MSEFAIPVVGALVINERNELFLMQSNGKFRDEWIVPGGKVQFGESLEAALRREIKEETNLDLETIRFLGTREMIHPRNHYIFLEFAARTMAPYHVILNHEAIGYHWFTPGELEGANLAEPTRELIRERLPAAMGVQQTHPIPRC